MTSTLFPYIQQSDVIVVILNYCNFDDTVNCVKSLQHLSSPPLEIVIVDNNSPDDSLSKIHSTLKGITLISSKSNLGYASGNNLGIQYALKNSNCRAIWILNNDTEVSPYSLQHLCETLNANPRSGIVGSTICYMTERNLIQCTGGSKLHPFLGTSSFCGYGMRLEDLMTPESQSFDFVNGACQLIRREVFTTIGLLPQEYFMYYEDADFCLRAQKADFKLSWAPASIVWHKEGGSSGANSKQGIITKPAWVDYLELRNRVWLARKYQPYILPIIALSYIIVAIIRIRRKQKERLPLVFKALWNGLMGNMGKPSCCPD